MRPGWVSDWHWHAFCAEIAEGCGARVAARVGDRVRIVFNDGTGWWQPWWPDRPEVH